jgi:hypothetical protein
MVGRLGHAHKLHFEGEIWVTVLGHLLSQDILYLLLIYHSPSGHYIYKI